MPYHYAFHYSLIIILLVVGYNVSNIAHVNFAPIIAANKQRFKIS